MKRVLILTFVAMLALTMASCDWDPTGVGTGSGSDGDDKKEREDKEDDKKERDKKERDGMMVRGMEGDEFDTPCDFTFSIQSIEVTETETDAANDKKPMRTVLVMIVVTHADGTTETFTFTKDSPGVTVGDCTIHLKGVKPMKTAGSDRVTNVAHFAITTGK